jgi:pimeloyl-ACP methyl ester carboxylesterase
MIVIAAALVLAALAILTAVGTLAIASAHPPSGRFIEVPGGRLHVVERGPADADAPTIVLLHGASGNLLDLRLALGERLAAHFRVILIDRPGHGWSDRPGGRGDGSPGRQAELIHQALARIGVKRTVMVGYSWSGALASAYALAYPAEIAGLVLLSPVTHPWQGGIGWLNSLIATPYIGSVIAYTVVVPAGHLLIDAGIRSVFAPQLPPPDYAERTAVRMILRPAEVMANAQDLAALKPFVTAQAPHYGEIAAPAVIIAGDDTDHIVSTDIHARAIAQQLPNGELTVLPGVGHMVHYAAPDLIVAAIDRLIVQSRRD